MGVYGTFGIDGNILLCQHTKVFHIRLLLHSALHNHSKELLGLLRLDLSAEGQTYNENGKRLKQNGT
jgi:hypothetical protein